MVDPALTPRPPYSGLLGAGSGAHGVVAIDRDGLGLASVAVRKGRRAALAQLIRDGYGMELPCGNYRVEANGIAFAGVGPESWLVTQDRGGNDLARSLTRQIGAVASIADQSDGYAVLRLTCLLYTSCERALPHSRRTAAAARRYGASRCGGLGLCACGQRARRRHHPEL